jgi:hypothetical protein
VLPAGRVRLVALKGIEYNMEERTLDLAAGETTDAAIHMTRWTNWNQRGWYTVKTTSTPTTTAVTTSARRIRLTGCLPKT